MSGKSIDVDYHSNDEAKEADIKYSFVEHRYTFEKRIYMYERHTYDEMVYTLPVKAGKVTLILKFAEVKPVLVRCTSGTQGSACSTLRSEVKL